MSNPQVKAILAGLFFGLWPLFMNRSGLAGTVSSFTFAFIAMVVVMPFALHTTGFAIPAANWLMVACGGIFGALGLLSFSGMLADVPPEKVGSFFVAMIIVQIMIPATYQVIMTQELPLAKAAGFALAIIAAFLLI